MQLVRAGKTTRISLDGVEEYMNNDGVKDELTLDSGVFVGGIPDVLKKPVLNDVTSFWT